MSTQRTIIQTYVYVWLGRKNWPVHFSAYHFGSSYGPSKFMWIRVAKVKTKKKKHTTDKSLFFNLELNCPNCETVKLQPSILFFKLANLSCCFVSNLPISG